MGDGGLVSSGLVGCLLMGGGLRALGPGHMALGSGGQVVDDG